MSGIVNSTGARSGVIGTTVASAIGTGTDGYVLTATGAGVKPAWEAAAGGGTIIQIVNGTYTGANSTDTTSATLARPVTAGAAYPWTGQITGVLASSWVDIRMTFLVYMYRSNQIHAAGFTIYRNADFTTPLFVASTGAQYEGDAATNAAHSTDRWHASQRVINLHWVDKSAGTGTNDYWLAYRSIASSTTTIYSEAVSGFDPFTYTLTEIAQ